MSVGISAACRYEDGPCIILCADRAGTRGELKSDDINKIREIGHCSILFAGDNSDAKDLLNECSGALKAYPKIGTHQDVLRLKEGLKEGATRRKRAISDAYLRSSYSLSFDEVFNFSNANPNNVFLTKAFEETKALPLGAELLINVLYEDDGQRESAILHLGLMGGEAKWQDGYGVVGSGGPIASAILRQRPYDEYMNIEECIYRVLESKVAAESTPYVGQDTTIMAKIQDGVFYLGDDYVEKTFEAIERHKNKFSVIVFSRDDLEPLEAGEDTSEKG